MTEVYINEQLVDLDETEVLTATYGNISFGQISKRKSVKSTQWKFPFTHRNRDVFDNCQVPSSDAEIPYVRNSIRVEVDGIIDFEGFCIVDETEGEYTITAYSGASDFYSVINTKKLTELDLSGFNHIWNQTNIVNSWNNTQGYMYAYVNYGKTIPFYQEGIPPSDVLPQLFFHTVVKQIATDAGYTLEGKVLDNQRFKNHVIIANKFPVAINYGGTWDLAKLLPDLTQSKVWLDFANIYGLMFDVSDVEKKITAIYIDDMLFNGQDDWTDKVDRSEKRKTSYRFKDYGQTSYLRYKYDDSLDSPVYQDFAKIINIGDQSLDAEKDIYKSEFFMIQDPDTEVNPGRNAITYTFDNKEGTSGNVSVWNNLRNYIVGSRVWLDNTYYQSKTVNTGLNPSTNTVDWTPIKEKDIWNIKNRPMYGAVEILAVPGDFRINFSGTVVNIPRRINNLLMGWQETYSRHYRVFDRIIRKPRIVDILMKLNNTDINQLDFSRAKVIDNELYFLQEVTQFKLNEIDSTFCKFVRI